MKKFIEELKRQNVNKAAIAYLPVPWVLIQLATIRLDTLNALDGIIQVLTTILDICLLIWIIIS